MTIQQFIEKAIQGGWRPAYKGCKIDYCHDGIVVDTTEGEYENVPNERLLLDPLAWQAVGKVEGWEDVERMHAKGGSPHEEGYCWCTHFTWKKQMHRMIDALVDGKTVEQFLETL